MYIPESVKVRVRHDKQYDNAITAKTNNIPLGFVTFVDEKGVLKKEKSWNDWGDEYIGEFPNKPISGYKLENMVTRSRHYFGSGRTLYRVIHPDGFVFEISTDNLFEICMEGNVKNGEFLGSYLLAWEGNTLILLGEESSDYSKYVEVTKIVNQGALTPIQLVVGQPYQDKNGEYIGHYYGKYPIVNIDYTHNYLCKDRWGNSTYPVEYLFIADYKKKKKFIFVEEIQWELQDEAYLHTTLYNTITAYPYVGDPKNLDISKYSIDDISADIYDIYDEVLINPYKNLDEVKDEITASVNAYVHNRNKDRDLNKESVDTKINWNTFPKVIK
jgi:hypothetical protein